MNCKFIPFGKISDKEWNNSIEKMEGHTHLYNTNFINYYCAFSKINNHSFLVEYENNFIAAVILAANKSKKVLFYGYDFGYCPSPIFLKKLRPSLKRKFLKLIINYIKNFDKNIKEINFFNHPIVTSDSKPEISSKNQFELIQFSKKDLVINTFVVNLSLTVEELNFNLSKYHKRNILRSSKKLKFNIFNGDNFELLKKKFEEFKFLHFKSAGKKTRPDKTWDIMLNNILSNMGILFSCSTNSSEISYLYCGLYKKFSWGWSQVNDRDFEKKFMPRHFLEWNAILYFKKKGFKYYELGENYKVANQNFSQKEISISEFKEKYGSEMYPKSFFNIKL